MSAKAFHMIENRLYSISAEETTFLEEPCYIFCLEQNPFPVGGSKHGIRFPPVQKSPSCIPAAFIP